MYNHAKGITVLQVFSILKATEGGKGQKMALIQLRSAGIKAKPCTSIYVGHTGVEVEGNQREIKKAEKIIFG